MATPVYYTGDTWPPPKSRLGCGHGMNKGQPLIGSIKLPYQHVEQLKERLAADHPVRRAAPSGNGN